MLIPAALAVAALSTYLLVRDRGESRALPTCARTTATIARPRDLPRSFPFPSGTVFTSRYRNRLTHGVPQVEGRMPLPLEEATRYFDNALPRAGYRFLYREARAITFRVMYETKGHGGQVTLQPLPRCSGATSFAVSARPTLLGRNNGA